MEGDSRAKGEDERENERGRKRGDERTKRRKREREMDECAMESYAAKDEKEGMVPERTALRFLSLR